MSTVLLIDPDAVSVRRYAEHLERAGFRVEIAAAEDARELRPDLVIIGVPHLERPRLQMITNGHVVPTIALSSDAADADRGAEFGYSAVLIRPVLYDRLVTAVRRVLKAVELPA